MPFVNFGPRRFGPRRHIINFKGDIDRLFDEFFGQGAEDDLGDFSPRTSIEDRPGAFVVNMELAGVPKENVKISFQKGRLYVAGEKLPEEDETSYLRNERLFGKFARSFQFPADVDAEKIEASFENGLLTINIAKAADVKEPHVEINIK